MRPNFAIGIDPDTKATGIGLIVRDVDGTSRPLFATVARAKGNNAISRAEGMADAILTAMAELRDYCEWEDGDHTMLPDVIAIEWQAVRPRDKRPNDIVNLCGIAGACLAAARLYFSDTPTQLILPGDWTRGIKKDIRHRRLARRWPDLLKTKGLDGVIASQQTHALDGLDLAHFALKDPSIRRRHAL